MAYVTQSEQCNLPNSETPMTQAQIDAQAARVGRVGSKFVAGNQAMSALVAGLTPPVPTGSCSDFTSSLSMRQSGRFPIRAFARGRYSLPAGSPVPGSNTAGLSPAIAAAITALALPVPVPSNSPAGAGVPAGPTSGGSGSGSSGTPYNNTGWPEGGSNPAGVEYPYGGVQRVLQMIAPVGCTPTSADGDLSMPIAGVAAGWWLGLGLLALALLASGDDKKQ